MAIWSTFRIVVKCCHGGVNEVSVRSWSPSYVKNSTPQMECTRRQGPNGPVEAHSASMEMKDRRWSFLRRHIQKPTDLLPIPCLLQIIPTRLLMNNIKQRLRTKPPRLRTPHSAIRIRRLLVPNRNRLLPPRPRRRLSHQLTLAALLHRQEPEHRLFHALPHSQQPMILQQRGFLPSKTSSDVFALFLREHDAVETLVEDVVVVESARILRQRIQFPS